MIRKERRHSQLNGSNTAQLPLMTDEQRGHFTVGQLVGALEGDEQVPGAIRSNVVAGQARHRFSPFVAGGTRIGNVVFASQALHKLADSICGDTKTKGQPLCFYCRPRNTAKAISYNKLPVRCGMQSSLLPQEGEGLGMRVLAECRCG